MNEIPEQETSRTGVDEVPADPPPTAPDEPTVADDIPTVASDAEADAEALAPVGGALARCVLTNRMNLNGILSSRLIGPRESFGKYYQDLLDLTGGFVAILPGAPADELVDYVSAKVRTGPALLELRADAYPLAETDDSVELAIAIPLADVTAIHLPDESSLREHLARPYSNVHPHENLLRVSPELFQGSVSLSAVRSATPPRQPSNPDTPTTTVHWQRIDRVRGAMNAAVMAASSTRTLAVASALLPGSDSRDWLGRHLREGTPPVGSDDPDALLLAAAVDVLSRTDVREAWNPADILDQIRAHLDAQPNAQPHQELIASNLATAEAVVEGTREFVPFRRTNRGLASAKALLLILLRQELAEILAWPRSETGADPETYQLAAVFAGLLRGLSRESVLLRNAPLDDLTARWACTAASGQPDRREAGFVIAHTDSDTRLSIAGEVLAQVPADPPGAADLFRALDAETQLRLANPIAELLNTTEGKSLHVHASHAELTSPLEGGIAMTLPGDATVETRWDLDALAAQVDEIDPELEGALMSLLTPSVSDPADAGGPI